MGLCNDDDRCKNFIGNVFHPYANWWLVVRLQISKFVFSWFLFNSFVFVYFRVIQIVLKFSVKTVHLKARYNPECYQFNITVGSVHNMHYKCITLIIYWMIWSL